MSDVVVTVPQRLWWEWLAEGDLPGEPWSGGGNHFWLRAAALPEIAVGERVYIVAHGRLRGYAPLVALEAECRMRPTVACLLREAGAVACTIAESIRGFQGWRYRFWERESEIPFPDWTREGVPL